MNEFNPMKREPREFETREGAERFCANNPGYKPAQKQPRGKGARTRYFAVPIETPLTAPPARSQSKRFEARPTSAFELPAATGNYLIKNVIDDGADIVAIRAAPGVGKSHLAVEMAACIALGKPWHGHRVRQGRVAYVAAEGAKGIRRKRLPAFRKHHGLTATDLDAIRWIDDVPNLSDAKDVDELIKQIGSSDLTVFDTFASVFEGDENGKESVDVALKHAQKIARATGGPVALVVHEGWSGERVRGWSGQFAAYDVEIAIARDDDIRDVAITKAKDGEERSLFSFKLRQVVLGHDADGDPITSCVIEECEPALSTVSGKNKAIVEAHLRTLPNFEATKDQLIEQIAPKLSRGKAKRDQRDKAVERAIKRLIDDGVAEFIDGRVRLKVQPRPDGAPDPFDIN